MIRQGRLDPVIGQSSCALVQTLGINNAMQDRNTERANCGWMGLIELQEIFRPGTLLSARLLALRRIDRLCVVIARM
jgi:hypothetical protein